MAVVATWVGELIAGLAVLYPAALSWPRMRPARPGTPAPLATSTLTCDVGWAGAMVVVVVVGTVELPEPLDDFFGALLVGVEAPADTVVAERGAVCSSTTPITIATMMSAAPFSVWVPADLPKDPSSRAWVPILTETPRQAAPPTGHGAVGL
jgi:hypothetical protein